MKVSLPKTPLKVKNSTRLLSPEKEKEDVFHMFLWWKRAGLSRNAAEREAFSTQEIEEKGNQHKNGYLIPAKRRRGETPTPISQMKGAGERRVRKKRGGAQSLAP